MSNVMRLRLPSRAQLFALAALVFVPAIVFAIAHPAAVLEEFAGLECKAKAVCTDDPRKLNEALDLYDGALQFLASSVAPLEERPLVIFCSTAQCYRFAARDGSAAKTVGRSVIVISPRGWKPYFVRHELIHRLQAEKLGVLGMYGKPEWFIEGMAYSLSEDPRAELPEPYQSDREHFRRWCAKVGKERMWSADPS